MTRYTTIGVKPDDHEEIKLTAWYERQKIAELVPLAVRIFSLMTPAERAEIMARHTDRPEFPHGEFDNGQHWQGQD